MKKGSKLFKEQNELTDLNLVLPVTFHGAGLGSRSKTSDFRQTPLCWVKVTPTPWTFLVIIKHHLTLFSVSHSHLNVNGESLMWTALNDTEKEISTAQGTGVIQKPFGAARQMQHSAVFLLLTHTSRLLFSASSLCTRDTSDRFLTPFFQLCPQLNLRPKIFATLTHKE